jgi:hypothetical protein
MPQRAQQGIPGLEADHRGWFLLAGQFLGSSADRGFDVLAEAGEERGPLARGYPQVVLWQIGPPVGLRACSVVVHLLVSFLTVAYCPVACRGWAAWARVPRRAVLAGGPTGSASGLAARTRSSSAR